MHTNSPGKRGVRGHEGVIGWGRDKLLPLTRQSRKTPLKRCWVIVAPQTAPHGCVAFGPAVGQREELPGSCWLGTGGTKIRFSQVTAREGPQWEENPWGMRGARFCRKGRKLPSQTCRKMRSGLPVTESCRKGKQLSSHSRSAPHRSRNLASAAKPAYEGISSHPSLSFLLNFLSWLQGPMASHPEFIA